MAPAATLVDALGIFPVQATRPATKDKSPASVFPLSIVGR